MTDTDAVLALAILILVLGGLWLYEWICTMESARRYQRWVQERKQVLATLEKDHNRQTSDS